MSRTFHGCVALSVLFAMSVAATAPLHAAEPPAIQKIKVDGSIRTYQVGNVAVAGQPSPQGFRDLKKQGFTTIISLRHPDEERFDQEALCEELGLEFVRLVISSPNDLNPKLAKRCSELMSQADQDSKVLLHCAAGARAGAAWVVHRVLQEQQDVDKAFAEAKQMGLAVKELKAAAKQCIDAKK
ncbi:hypothetical protein SV7mr_41520 [Stieleria bergensis]|uniref:DSP-PTPase phosphatase fused to NAD+ Kinase domain-containing protein n=2 Tax=Stieleria bergensis TaxID=2528025 RepID=A0A517SZN5_9BACT|nr:hypothetical protein SV7mr_41520 [Planctomycetes bacterium SV_7m_r]